MCNVQFKIVAHIRFIAQINLLKSLMINSCNGGYVQNQRLHILNMSNFNHLVIGAMCAPYRVGIPRCTYPPLVYLGRIFGRPEMKESAA
jgi:hypothetical protein